MLMTAAMSKSLLNESRRNLFAALAGTIGSLLSELRIRGQELQAAGLTAVYGSGTVRAMFLRSRLAGLLALFLLGWYLTGIRVHAQTNPARLRSFGFPSASVSQPEGRLLSSTNGFLYGTSPFGGSNGLGCVFKVARDGTGLTIVRHFSGPADGRAPYGGVLEGKDGLIYGTTYSGGGFGFGTLYRMANDGSGFTVMRHFGQSFADGKYPLGRLFEGVDGFLYGTASEGGTNDFGMVFRILRTGGGYHHMYSFTATGEAGQSPNAGVVQHAAEPGAVYGTTPYGGTNGFGGVVFRLATNGAYSALKHFDIVAPGPTAPFGGVTAASDGVLYGLSQLGGTNDTGSIFKLNRDGSGFSVLRSFDAFNDGAKPLGALLDGSDGLLYGSTTEGGANQGGILFRINRNGSGYQILRNGGLQPMDARAPYAGFTEVTGALFTVSSSGTEGASSGTLLKINRDGTGYQILGVFGVNGGDGQSPVQPLNPGPGGWLYGVTPLGGQFGGGTVFRADTNGSNYSVLRSFGPATNNGYVPAGSPVDGGDGFLYGTLGEGGASGRGLVYKMQTNGAGFSVIRAFTASASDGSKPAGPLLLGSDGALFGTTVGGGQFQTGAVFRLTRDGSEFSILHAFESSGTDGVAPDTGVVEGSDGLIYGVTYGGGPSDAGTIYRVDKFGLPTSYQILRQFGTNSTGGTKPRGRLMEASDGYLYGTALAGGSTGNGTVFRLLKDGSGYSVLKHFTAEPTEGWQPNGRLAEGPDGLLYGIVTSGGASNSGGIFRIGKDGGSYALFASFGQQAGDGRVAAPGLAWAAGKMFGVTSDGGLSGIGTLFQVTVPPALPTFTSQPASLIVTNGGIVTFAALASGPGPLAYQWQFNGVNLAGATNTSFSVTNLSAASAGTYRLVVTGPGGSITSSNAVAASFGITRSGNLPQYVIAGPLGRNFRLEARSSLATNVSWTTLTNFSLGTNPTQISDPANGQESARFVRAVLLP